LADCESLLAEILRQERESEHELVRRRDETARQLAGMSTVHKARDAYLEQTTDPAGQLDLTS